MNRLFQDNPIGIALAGVSAFLVLCMLCIFIWSLIPVGDPDISDSESALEAELKLPELAEPPPLESFSEIVQRPLFNSTRQPIIVEELAVEGEVEELPPPDETELEVELSGVIITPTLRMATLKRKDGSKSLVAFEGRYLEGEFGSWQLSQVADRAVTLTSGSGKELKLELQVHDERIEPPKPAVAAISEKESSAEADNPDNQSNEPLSRADEIRQRIAERREELRRQAAENDQSGEEVAEPNYQDAIRAMINRRPAPKENSESKNDQ